MLRTRNIALTSEAVEVTIDDVVNAPNSIAIQNISDVGFAYIGDENVSVSNYGFRIYPAHTITMDISSYEKVYACGDNDVNIAVLILDHP
jgi:hypothetical protein